MMVNSLGSFLGSKANSDTSFARVGQLVSTESPALAKFGPRRSFLFFFCCDWKSARMASFGGGN